MFKKGILPKKIRVISMLLVISIIAVTCFYSIIENKSNAAQYKEAYIESKILKYPGYKDLIVDLKSKHPNWNFKIFYTGLDWNQVIKNETSANHGANLVSKSSTGAWVCSTCGDKLYDTERWKCASEAAVSYYMDPRNWLNENNIFQFEELTYDSNTQTLDGVKKILDPAIWTRGDTITYTKTDGNTAVINKSYAQIIMEAAQAVNISPYHLASRMVLEQGKNQTASSTGCGTRARTCRLL